LESYERFSFAAWVEYECMMKAASVFRDQRLYADMEDFIREHIGKYLDDSFDQFGHFTKALICLNSAEVYRKVGAVYEFSHRLSLFSLFHLSQISLIFPL
uniref:Terpene_synth_C domain-containing protein n=1 Tax=Brugia timori TaxID=42155 RepID=A0A0R3QBS8_9BILA